MNVPKPSVPELAPLVPNFRGYGQGWDLSDYAGHKLVSHTGGWPGQVSRLTLLPGKNLGVIVLTSAELGVAFNAITYRALDMMLGREGNDWLKAYAAAYAKSQADADTSWQKHLAARVVNTTPSSGPSTIRFRRYGLVRSWLPRRERGHSLAHRTASRRSRRRPAARRRGSRR